MRTLKLKIPFSEYLDALNAASASVWYECLKLKEMWDYAHGYRTTSKACELWMDKQLSKTQPLHSQSIQAVRERYFIGVDIGEIHPIVSHDGHHTTIFNGRYIRSLYRLRNKVLASMNAKIDRCQRHSKRWWHLVRRKWKHIKKIENQIRDCLHKQTTKFLTFCESRSIGTIVLGDLTGIRETINYGSRANQKLHQWAFSKLTELITYKAKSLGIKVVSIDEAYTSQTCPKCGNRKKPRNRNYTCKCGFQYHRDGVGAINIRQKYLGHFGVPVVADMTPPVGFRLEVKRCSVLTENVPTRDKRTSLL